MFSKEEYLKRYLSDGGDRRKKQRTDKLSRMKILDDDIDVKALIPKNITNTIDEDIGADKPLVASFVDERPRHVIELEKFRQDKRWKIVNQSNDDRATVVKCSAKSSVKGDRISRNDSDSDASPMRNSVRDKQRCRHDSDSDSCSEKKVMRHDSDSDLSPPPRRTVKSSDVGDNPWSSNVGETHKTESSRHKEERTAQKRRLSPSVLERAHPRHKNSSDSDQSPERGVKVHRNVNSPKRHHSRTACDSDFSPERREVAGSKENSQNGASDLLRRSGSSGQRADRHNSRSDLSPARKQSKQPDDSSPSRRTLNGKIDSGRQHETNRDRDLSPPRKTSSDRVERDLSPPRKSSSDRVEKATKTLSGAKAGLQSASDMKIEAKELKRKEDEAFAKISDDMFGRNAKTVHRDKTTGHKRNLEEEQSKKAAENAARNVAAAKYQDWNKGLKQKEMKESILSDAIHEADKPLARYRDDADLDAQLRDQEREEDPMLAYIKKKKAKNIGPVKPRYSGPEPPANRFNIWPGYRWDGVDRSNGFEKQYFASLSNKQAIKEMSYKWSVEDM